MELNPLLIKNHLYVKFNTYYNIKDIEEAIDELKLEHISETILNQEYLIEIPDQYLF